MQIYCQKHQHKILVVFLSIFVADTNIIDAVLPVHSLMPVSVFCISYVMAYSVYYHNVRLLLLLLTINNVSNLSRITIVSFLCSN